MPCPILPAPSPTEAENTCALSIVQARGKLPAIIARKRRRPFKVWHLEVVDTKESLDSVGGLDELKTWLIRRKQTFSPKAKEFGLPCPKGLLIVGIPGMGKSLSAKATAAVFGIPLLKLDMGRIYGGLVGQSEGNLRQVIQTAEAMTPCILWIDEIEKGFSGTKSSGVTDGGTSARVFGSFLSWIHEALTGMTPLSQLMSDQITALRQWAKGRARRATSQVSERKLRKLAA